MDQQLSKFLKGMRILYAEDEKISREILQYYLMQYDITLDVVDNGATALETYQQHTYDIVISDIGMPQMDGIELARRIKEINPLQRILIASAYNDSDRLLQLIDIGVDNFVLKPFDDVRLKKVLLRLSEELYTIKELKAIRRNEKEALEYTQIEQQKAHKKQKSIVTNDLLHDSEFSSTVYYVPSDILSGDSYSVHKQKDGSLVMYIVDAMGHGILPSLTSFAIAFMVKQYIKEEKSFHDLSHSLLYNLKSLLNEFEQLSCIFVHINAERSKLSYFSAGMYPGFIRCCGESRELPANNIPIMNFCDEIQITEMDISCFSELLIYSDALVETEAQNISPKFLREYIASGQAIETLLNELSGNTYNDDLTAIYLKLNTLTPCSTEKSEL